MAQRVRRREQRRENEKRNTERARAMRETTVRCGDRKRGREEWG